MSLYEYVQTTCTKATATDNDERSNLQTTCPCTKRAKALPDWRLQPLSSGVKEYNELMAHHDFRLFFFTRSCHHSTPDLIQGVLSDGPIPMLWPWAGPRKSMAADRDFGGENPM